PGGARAGRSADAAVARTPAGSGVDEEPVRTLDELDVRGRRVLVRVDFNVPLRRGQDGVVEVADDARIRASLETIEELRARQARLLLASHLGRPAGRREEDLSMAPVARRLREVTGAAVTLAPAVVGEEVVRRSK